MSKQYLEIELKAGTDAMKISERINTFSNMKCHVVDVKTIRVWFNENKVTAKKILKIVAAITCPDHRNRKRNVTSVKESSSSYRTNYFTNENKRNKRA